jgi:aryl-alcohol dehydrogenase
VKIAAAVLRERGAPLQVEEVELSEPRSDEVLVRLAVSGICHADSLARDGDLPFPVPGVLGHEGAGEVIAVGASVTSLAEGDRVVLSMPWCGRCRACLAGQPRYCEHVLGMISGGGRADGSTSLRDAAGGLLHSHFFGQSSYATHCVVRANQAVRVDRAVPLEVLGHLGCGVATGAGAILNVLRPSIGASVVIFGVGTVGLAAVMAARCSPATRIVAVDRVAARLKLAADLGATETIEARTGDDLAAMVRAVCDGPADLALECTGNLAVVRAAVDCIGMLGICGLVGGAPAGAELTVDHHTTMIGKRIVGIHGGEGQSATVIPGLIELHRQGRLPVERLVQEFELADVAEAMAASDNGEVVKPVLRMPS